jgi:hypothetical protein
MAAGRQYGRGIHIRCCQMAGQGNCTTGVAGATVCITYVRFRLARRIVDGLALLVHMVPHVLAHSPCFMLAIGTRYSPCELQGQQNQNQQGQPSTHGEEFSSWHFLSNSYSFSSFLRSIHGRQGAT